MKAEIRLATLEDIDAIEKLYEELNDYLAATINYPGWKKGVYPTREDAAAGVDEGCLFAAVYDNAIAGSMILRQRPEPVYATVAWQKDLSDSEVLVLYTFAVNPRYHKQGIGKQMLVFAAEYAAKRSIKAIRLDVYEGNLPAISLYKKSGFQYIQTVSLGLEAYGLNWFELYEKILQAGAD